MQFSAWCGRMGTLADRLGTRTAHFRQIDADAAVADAGLKLPVENEQLAEHSQTAPSKLRLLQWLRQERFAPLKEGTGGIARLLDGVNQSAVNFCGSKLLRHSNREGTMTRFLLIAVTLLLGSSLASANCGSGTCAVGAFGTGGDSSGGKAQGFHLQFPSTRYPGETFSNVGNFDAGRLNVTNQGSYMGTVRDDVFRGRTDGVFGDSAGLCDFEDFLNDDC
jgi:hypothetical protein